MAGSVEIIVGIADFVICCVVIAYAFLDVVGCHLGGFNRASILLALSHQSAVWNVCGE